jgi:hypothetical protein
VTRLVPLVRAGCPSELHLDRLVVGELAADEDRAARAHVEGCAACRGRLASIEAARAAFVELDAGRGLAARPRARRRWIGAATAIAAVTAMIVIVTQPSRDPGDGSDDRGARTKGSGDTMAVYVARGAGSGATTRVTAGDTVAAGDTLQMTITLRERRFVALLGIDATRVARVYFPDGDHAAAVEPGSDVVLPSSIRLDATPGREDFVALFCDEPIALGPVRAALSVDPAAVPAGCTGEQLHVNKPPAEPR